MFCVTNLAPTDFEVASSCLEKLCTLGLRMLSKIRHDPYGWRDIARGKGCRDAQKSGKPGKFEWRKKAGSYEESGRFSNRDQNPGLRKTEFNLTLNDVVRVLSSRLRAS